MNTTRNPVLLTDDYDRRSYCFANFENLVKLETQGKQAVQEAVNQGGNTFTREWGSRGNGRGGRMNFDSDFVATNYNDAEQADFIEYVNQQALNDAISSFDNFLGQVNMGGAFEKAKLIITDDKKGIFDFGLASKGLYRLPEYFSEELKVEGPLEFPQKLPGIVPDDFVRKDQLEQFWYDSPNLNKSFLLERRQKGTTEMLIKNPDAKIIIDNTGLKYTDVVSYKDVQLEFATTTKKSYVMFQKKGGKAKMVELYVGIGGLWNLNFQGMLAKAMPLFLCAKYFESVGIRTRISAARMYTEGNRAFMVTYVVKEYGEDMNFNYLGINVADPRWFRWNLWKYTSALSVVGKIKEETIGYGSTIYGGDQLYETFNRYKNWYFEQMEQGLQPIIPVDRNLMICGGLDEPNNNSLQDTDAIKDEFYRILDIVDFQFNKPEKAAERIYKRMKEENSRYSIQDIKTYIQSVAAQANSFPQAGEYATPSEIQDVLEDKYDEILLGMNKFLATI
jgi:hypothetical protein